VEPTAGTQGETGRWAPGSGWRCRGRESRRSMSRSAGRSARRTGRRRRPQTAGGWPRPGAESGCRTGGNRASSWASARNPKGPCGVRVAPGAGFQERPDCSLEMDRRPPPPGGKRRELRKPKAPSCSRPEGACRDAGRRCMLRRRTDRRERCTAIAARLQREVAGVGRRIGQGRSALVPGSGKFDRRGVGRANVWLQDRSGGWGCNI